MKTNRFSFLMLAAVAMLTLFSASCGNKQGDSAFGVTNVLKRIPADAVGIAVVNVGQLMNKLDYEDFKKSEIFKSMISEAKDDMAKQILENPESSGIATNGQFCMYLDVKGQKDFTFGILLPVKNVKDLEAVFEKSAKSKEDSPFKKIEDAKEFKFIERKEDDMNIGIGWDKKMVVIVVSSKAGAKDVLANVFDSKRKESILTNKNFKADKAEGHDVMLWVQSDPIVKMLKDDESMSTMIKQISFLGLTEKSLDGNTVAMYYDFKKGEMESGISYKMNPDIEKEYGIIFKKKIETDFSAYFPKKHLNALTMMGLDMKGVQKVLKNRSLDGMADSYLSSMGLTLEEIAKGFKGEVAFASYADPAATDALKAQKMVVAISFDKAELFEKLMTASKELGAGEIKKSGNRYMSAASKDVQAIFKNNVFIVSNDLSILDKIEAGGYKGDEAVEKQYYADMSKGWMSGHVDYGQLLSSLEDMPIGTMGIPAMSNVFKMLSKYNELVATTGVISTEDAKVMITLKNKDDNSLKVLSKLVNKLYLDRDNIKNEMEKAEEEEDNKDRKTM